MNVSSLSLKAVVAMTAAVASAALGVASGCSDDEKACSIGETECLDARLARVCAPTGPEKEPNWIPFECGEGNECIDSEGDGGGEGGEAACVGTCTQGEVECVTGEVSRYCLDGRVWQLDPCAVGERCAPGIGCGVDQEGGVRACEPGARSCAADDVAKVCDVDGSSWIPLPCAGYETCSAATGTCEPDPGASCDALGGVGGGICLDDTTAVRCSARVGGFELDECPTGTYCSGGRCIGDVCAIGSTCVGLNQIRTCIDGTNQRDSQCESNEICVQDGDEASCIVPTCIPDDKVCGDPNDPSVDPASGYSVCVHQGATNTGVPVWQFTQCEGQLECSPTLVDTANPCRKQCTPGEQICANDGFAGIHEGWVECDADGNWGPITNCNPDPTASLELVCANKPFQAAGEVNQVACAEPVCAAVWNNLLDVSNTGGVPLQQGTCEGTQIRECDPDTGALQTTAADCREGICQIASTIPTGDGLLRGQCEDVAECAEGESICVVTGIATVTPYFRSCVGGAFAAELERCDQDQTCFDSVTVDGLRIASCGGECGEGWTRCGVSGIETCGTGGTWGTEVACSEGHCENVGSNQAKCVLDCIPGELGCGGTTVTASDGIHTGTSHAITCKPDGTWPIVGLGSDDSYVAACDQPGGEACRISSRGEGLGCVQCVGPNVLGGNVDGVTETRCDPVTPANLQQCAADNTWGASSACGTGTTCTGPQQVCLACQGENGVFDVCTETNMNNVPEVCGACSLSSVIGVVSPACSESQFPQLATDAGPVQLTCASEGLGAPSLWGGVADCCGGLHQTGTVGTCELRGYGQPSAWGGVPDCCQDFQTYTGSGLAYCAP